LENPNIFCKSTKKRTKNYYTAEEYHQDYLDKNPDGYCHLPASLFEFARQAKEKK
jgi:peptide methionine sulfoxide reductase MsrA